MSDIVERLRREAECDAIETAREYFGETFECGDAIRWAKIMNETADEIERLRNTIKLMANIEAARRREAQHEEPSDG